MTIDFLKDRIVLRFPNYQAASKLGRSPLPNQALLARVLRFSDQRVLANVGNFKELELFPRPSLLVRLLSPQVRRLAKAGS